jgi:hypothetical protein
MKGNIMTWKDPTLGYPNDTLREGIVKHDRYYAVSGKWSHKSISESDVIHCENMDHVDDKEWELFRASSCGMIDGKEYIWGMFVLGLGAFNVMIDVDQIREPNEAEKKRYSESSYGIYGSHSGKFSYSLPSPSFK